MLAVQWVSSSVCLLDVSADGNRARLCLVADIPSAEDQVSESSPSVQDVDAVLLCGAVVPSFLVRHGWRPRILASEPVAKMIGLVGGVGADEIERCQIEERVAIGPASWDVQVSPVYSGGSLIGSSDWVVRVKGQDLVTFCGARGRGALPPRLSRHLLLGVPHCGTKSEVHKLLTDVCTKHSSQKFIVLPVPDDAVLFALGTLWTMQSSFRLSLESLPTWCQRFHSICQRYESCWGRGATKSLPQQQSQPTIILVLESEVYMLQKVCGDVPIVRDHQIDFVDRWSESDVQKTVQVRRPNGGRVILGPLWSEAVKDCQAIRTNVTYFLEGESTADKAVEIVVETLQRDDPKSIAINGTEFSVESLIRVTLLGQSSVQIEADESLNDADLQAVATAFQRLDGRRVQRPGWCNQQAVVQLPSPVPRALPSVEYSIPSRPQSATPATRPASISQPASLPMGSALTPYLREAKTETATADKGPIDASRPVPVPTSTAPSIKEAKSGPVSSLPVRDQPKTIDKSASPPASKKQRVVAEDEATRQLEPNDQDKVRFEEKEPNDQGKARLEEKAQKLKVALETKGGPSRQLPLSEIAKMGEFGDKTVVMELVRKHPAVFKVIIEGEAKKRTIGLV